MMDYIILETHLIFKNNVLETVVVLCDGGANVFAAMSTRTPIAGYYNLTSYDIPTMTLFNRVASFGRKLNSEEKIKYFQK